MTMRKECVACFLAFMMNKTIQLLHDDENIFDSPIVMKILTHTFSEGHIQGAEDLAFLKITT